MVFLELSLCVALRPDHLRKFQFSYEVAKDYGWITRANASLFANVTRFTHRAPN